MRAGAGALLLALLLAGCGGGSGGGDEDAFACPAMESGDGIINGLDLPLPSWLPAGVTLPEGFSIRHIDEAGEVATVAGVAVGGDAAGVVATVHDGLVEGGYEILLHPDFIPRSSDAVVALHPGLGWLVKLSVTPDHLAEVAIGGGDCTYRDAVQAQRVMSPVADPAAERALWAGSSVSRGTGVAEVSGHRFESAGECFVHDGTWRFTPDPDVTWVDLSVTPATDTAVGNAMVHDGTEDLMYVLTPDTPPGAVPDITVSDSGFSTSADLTDVIGEEGFVPGTIPVTCAESSPHDGTG